MKKNFFPIYSNGAWNHSKKNNDSLRMPQTFYIENDEEIISVIGRLRKSSFEENYFVFPKRAIVLQSIVNLRLFQREAEKLGKRIIIVTQDDAGKTLAEKAGLATERYTDDFARQSAHLEIPASSMLPQTESPSRPLSDHTGLRAKDIGSNDFYATNNAVSSSSPVSAHDTARSLRIRNASPEKLTHLNSQRQMATSPVGGVLNMDFHPQVSLPKEREAREVESRSIGIARPLPSQSVISVPTVQKGREERLRSFFTNGGVSASEKKQPPVVAPRRETNVPEQHDSAPVVSQKAKLALLFLGGVSLISLLGVGSYFLLPKAEVHIIPYRTTASVDLTFDGRPDTGNDSRQVIAVRVVEKEQSITLTTDATGTSPGSAQKARGTVTLMNTFSADAQPLVATTRLESSDGKVFRITEGVTVPGIKGSVAGTVDVTVVADLPGAEYNITPTTFTIPGFKGSPKFDKFSAQSTKAMAGGSSSSGATQTIISKADLEQVAVIAKQKAKQAYLDAVTAELRPGERILEENLDIVSLRDASLPLSGTVATSFEYQNTFTVRGFIFPEDTLKKRIIDNGEERVSNIVFRPVSVMLTYGDAVPDFTNGTVRLKTHAVIASDSVIDREALMRDILGKNASGIDTLLGSYPAIKKIEINFKPHWFTSTVPNSDSRVTLLLESGQE